MNQNRFLFILTLLGICQFHQCFQFKLISSDIMTHRRHIVSPHTNTQSLYSFLSNFRWNKPADDDFNKKIDDDMEVQFEKPWRAPKVKYLTYNYQSWKETWKERYVTPKDLQDTVYFYTATSVKPVFDRNRAEDMWSFPWLWSKTKTERLAWIMKLFFASCESLSVQEHMEMDAFFAEFDMPARWGTLRVKEIDVLTVLVLNIAFWTDFNGIRPTDLGLRPDGSVRTCPVEVYDCISSSNDPVDTDHYAPPLKWSRSKSPEQAYDEIKNVYLNYPKRGLRWSYGWIDRGGWKPQQFGGPYFYAQADSLLFHFTDDIELVLDYNKREVQYRSEPRFRQLADGDVQRLRYNQFVRMLMSKGGWDIQPIEKLNYYPSLPFRATQELLDKSIDKTSKTIEQSLTSLKASYESALLNDAEGGNDQLKQQVIRSIGNIVEQSIVTAQRVYVALYDYISPYIQPIITSAEDQYDMIRFDPKVAAAIQTLQDLQNFITSAVANFEPISVQKLDQIVERIYKLFPEKTAIDINKEDSVIIKEDKSSIDSSIPSMEEGTVIEENSIKSNFNLGNKDFNKDNDDTISNGAKDFKKYMDYFRETQTPSSINNNMDINKNSNDPLMKDQENNQNSNSNKNIVEDMIEKSITSSQPQSHSNSMLTSDVEWVLDSMDSQDSMKSSKDALIASNNNVNNNGKMNVNVNVNNKKYLSRRSRIEFDDYDKKAMNAQVKAFGRFVTRG